jgi:site-specific recombinase XerD
MDGTNEHGKRQRRSLKTRSWTLAQTRLAEYESGQRTTHKPEHKAPLLKDAVETFLADCRARNLAASTVNRYKNPLDRLAAFFDGRRVFSVTLAMLTEMRNGQTAAANTSKNEITTLRTFFRFCEDREWIAKNPASRLKAPKPDQLPTMPFDPKEIDRILEQCDLIPDSRGLLERKRTRDKAKALVLVLLYSGLRISDAVKLERTKLDINTGRLLIRMMKTKVPLYVTLPPVALAALKALPDDSPHFFWNGKSKLSGAIRTGTRTIEHLMERANVEGGHAHRFRDTFAVELLQHGGPDRRGVDIRTVQLLLGHTSVKTTEKHYAPFVASMQRSLDEAVSTLQFGSQGQQPSPTAPDAALDSKAAVNTNKNRRRNRELNVLPFARPQGA